MTDRTIEDRSAERMLELEESAEGTDLFRTPGSDMMLDQARDQAEASGWIPEREEREATHRVECGRRDAVRQAMDRLEEAAARPAGSSGWAAEVEAALDELSAAVDVHISATEHPDGFLDEILVVAPRLGPMVAEIRMEHSALRAAIARVRSNDGGDVRAMRRRVLRLLGRLVEHRQRGSDLVYEAYSVDLGAGD